MSELRNKINQNWPPAPNICHCSVVNHVLLPLVSAGLESFVKVNITVQDINDNKPELAIDEIFLCENDVADTVRKTVFGMAFLYSI